MNRCKCFHCAAVKSLFALLLAALLTSCAVPVCSECGSIVYGWLEGREDYGIYKLDKAQTDLIASNLTLFPSEGSNTIRNQYGVTPLLERNGSVLLHIESGLRLRPEMLGIFEFTPEGGLAAVFRENVPSFVSRYGDSLLLVDDNGQVVRIDSTADQITTAVVAAASEAVSVFWNFDGTSFYILNSRGQIRVHDCTTGDIRRLPQLDGVFRSPQFVCEVRAGQYLVLENSELKLVSSSGQLLAKSDEKHVRRADYDRERGRVLYTVPSHNESILLQSNLDFARPCAVARGFIPGFCPSRKPDDQLQED